MCQHQTKLYKSMQASFIIGSQTKLTLLLLLIVSAFSLSYLLANWGWMRDDQAAYTMPIWPCVLKYARSEHQAGQLGSSTDFEILLIASLANNMMHVTFDNTIRRGVRALGLMKLFWEGGVERWMLFSTTLTLQMAAREQRCLTQHTHTPLLSTLATSWWLTLTPSQNLKPLKNTCTHAES